MNEPIPKLYRARFKTYSVVRDAESPPTSGPIRTPAAVAHYLLLYFREADAGREHFAVLYLTTKHKAIAAKILFSGGVGETAVHPGVIARDALLCGASAVAVAHNHPSGDLSPSTEDRAVARTLTEALKTLSIHLLDSLVLSVEDGHFHSIVTGETG